MNAARTLHHAAIAAGVVLVGIYFYLNAGKVQRTRAVYDALLEGRPPAELVLRAQGEELVHAKLASTGFFDATGSRQLHFLPLPQEDFEHLREKTAGMEVLIDGERTEPRILTERRFVAVQLPRRLVYLVQEGDPRTIAALLWREKRNALGVLRCNLPDNRCAGLRMQWAAGVGPLEGPYLDTDIVPLRRGMPRGRWGVGPETRLAIETREATTIRLHLVLLDPSREQKILITSPGGEIQRILGKDPKPVRIAGKAFHVKEYLVQMRLEPGPHELHLGYGDWQSGERKPGRAVYILQIAIQDIDNS